MLKYIFAALLILVVWGLWWWLKLPMWIALVATLVIVLILATIIIWGVLKARRAANKIEKALAGQGAKQAANARPDMQADVNAMQNEFSKAVGELKRSSKEALFTLPWYIIIGPPGMGKSTALRKSGLTFAGRSGAVKGIGGTRNCDWWMANQAVIVDTAGRYTTEDTDRDEWLAFLDLLKDTRPKRPINVIMLAIAVTDLAGYSEDQISGTAQKIRARIDEVTSRLEMSVPVYVLFTKCDLLPGFVEMYSEMGKTERAAIWGFTLPVLDGAVARDPIGVFADQFDRLADRNEQRAFRRLGDERRLDSRGKIYAFPQQFESLRDNLASFVGQVFASNMYAETPLLRGCYFTSGTQEGRPIDRLMGSMAQAFGMQGGSLAPGQQQTEERSYFLGNLFNKVIFADRELAQRSAKHLRKAKILRWGGASAVFATALGTAVLPVRSMRQNQAVLAQVDDAGKKVEEHVADDTASVIKLERLAPLYEVEEELRGFETDSTPVKLRWGMYQGDQLYPQTEASFGKVGREELVVPLMAERTEVLKRFTARYANENDEPPPDEAAENFDILRMYLLLAGDLGTYRTGLKDTKLGEERVREDSWLIEQIARYWARALLVTDEADKAKMKDIATAWVRVLREQPELEIELDAKLVADAQAVLKRSDRTEAWLAELILESGKTEGVRDLGLRDMVTTQFYKNDDVRIRGAFTRAGWEKYGRGYLSRLPGEFVGSEWVLGLSDEEAASRNQLQRLRLRSRYFEQYIQEWNTFVSKIYIDTPDALVDSLKMFQDLSRGANPPLKALLVNVSYNCVLEEEKLEPGEKPWFTSDNWPEQVKTELKKGAVGPSGEKLYFENIDVPKHFEHLLSFGVPPTPPPGEPPVAAALEIDGYQEQLQLVRDAMQAAVDDPVELPALGKRLKSSTTVVKGQVGGQGPSRWPARAMARSLRRDLAAALRCRTRGGRRWRSPWPGRFVVQHDLLPLAGSDRHQVSVQPQGLRHALVGVQQLVQARRGSDLGVLQALAGRPDRQERQRVQHRPGWQQLADLQQSLAALPDRSRRHRLGHVSAERRQAQVRVRDPDRRHTGHRRHHLDRRRGQVHLSRWSAEMGADGLAGRGRSRGQDQRQGPRRQEWRRQQRRRVGVLATLGRGHRHGLGWPAGLQHQVGPRRSGHRRADHPAQAGPRRDSALWCAFARQQGLPRAVRQYRGAALGRQRPCLRVDRGPSAGAGTRGQVSSPSRPAMAETVEAVIGRSR